MKVVIAMDDTGIRIDPGPEEAKRLATQAELTTRLETLRTKPNPTVAELRDALSLIYDRFVRGR